LLFLLEDASFPTTFFVRPKKVTKKGPAAAIAPRAQRGYRTTVTPSWHGRFTAYSVLRDGG